MKLTTLFENPSETVSNLDKYKDYILCNHLFGGWAQGNAVNGLLKKFFKSAESKVDLPGKYFLDNLLSTTERQEFLHSNKNDLEMYQFSGDTISDFPGISLYAYDYIGKPPFKFSISEEFYTFGFFENCSTLTEIPNWIPPVMHQFQLVGSNVKSLKNIHKVIKECVDIYIGENDNVRKVSYLAGIKNLQTVTLKGYPGVSKSINAYLDSTNPRDRDIFDLQNHLIDDDWEMFA